MKIRFAMFAAQCVAIAFLNPVTVVAQDISRAFLCEDIRGVNIGAPKWQPFPDGYPNLSILVSYKPGNTLSRVTSYRNGAIVQDGEGPGMQMNSGFVVVVFGKEYVETYVVNVDTLELFHSAIRSGSAMLPNSAKSFHGVCKPAGNLAR